MVPQRFYLLYRLYEDKWSLYKKHYPHYRLHKLRYGIHKKSDFMPERKNIATGAYLCRFKLHLRKMCLALSDCKEKNSKLSSEHGYAVIITSKKAAGKISRRFSCSGTIFLFLLCRAQQIRYLRNPFGHPYRNIGNIQ